MIDLIYRPVYGCTQGVGVPCILAELSECPSDGVVACDEYWNSEADDMRERSYVLTGLWVAIIVVNAVGNILLFWGFGHASERMSRRVRDAAFQSLVRQDVSFFDKRKVGKITSELQEDATRIQVFTGDPIRQFLMSVSGVATGVVISFVVSIRFRFVFYSNDYCPLNMHQLCSIFVQKFKKTVHVAVRNFSNFMYPCDGIRIKLRNETNDGRRHGRRRQRERRSF